MPTNNKASIRSTAIRYTPLALIGLVLAALVGCGSLNKDSATPTSSNLIDQQKAIDIALQMAMSSLPEVSGSKVLPREIEANEMTLEEAVKIVWGNADVPAGYQPTISVWVVTMEGYWTDEFPRPTGLPTSEPYRHFAVIIDATTGLGIGGSHSP